MKNTTQQPLQWKWTHPIDKSWEFHFFQLYIKCRHFSYFSKRPFVVIIIKNVLPRRFQYVHTANISVEKLENWMPLKFLNTLHGSMMKV